MTTKPAAPGILGHWLAPFEAPFTGPTRRNPLVPLAGATPAPGRRTHHPYPARIALGVDHEHALPALDLLVGVVPARAALRAGLHALRVDDRGRRPALPASREAAAGDQDA